MKKNIKTKQIFIKYTVIAIIVILFAILTIKSWPHIASLAQEETRNNLLEYFRSIGIWGVLIFIFLQIIQIVVAFIPGEPFELLLGLIYGGFNGFLICTLGILAGTVVVYYGVKFLRNSLFKSFIPKKEFKKFKFLNSEKNIDLIVFILFFIPGTPKDALIYFAPFTPIKPIKFFILSSIARIPSVISSTFAGNAAINGDWQLVIIIFAVMGFLSILGIIYYKKILELLAKLNKKS